jgi:Fe-S-cluster-containing hydrogenase component 2
MVFAIPQCVRLETCVMVCPPARVFIYRTQGVSCPMGVSFFENRWVSTKNWELARNWEILLEVMIFYNMKHIEAA